MSETAHPAMKDTTGAATLAAITEEAAPYDGSQQRADFSKSGTRPGRSLVGYLPPYEVS
ncbi:MAG TPA: hypothetical protein VH934_21680 [Xanthobacteraceae bacterium]